MNRGFRTLLAALVAGVAACSPSAGLEGKVATYQDLANRHDVDGLLGLYAEDAQMDFGPLGVMEGRDRIRAIHEYDRAIGTEIEFRNCVVEARTVACQTVERNAWLETAGIERIEWTRSAFTFDEAGRISHVTAELSPGSGEAMGGAIAAFDAWARAHRGDAYLALFDEAGRFNYGYDNGVRVLELLGAWRDAAAATEDLSTNK